MKKIILLFTVLVSINSFSQKGRYNKKKTSSTPEKIKLIDSISSNKLESLINDVKYKNIVSLNNYETINGDWLKVGDTLVIGKPSNANNMKQTGAFGSKVNYHTHIFLGSVASMVMGGATFGNERMMGDKVFITAIKMSRLSKKNNYTVSIEFNKVGGGRFLGTKKIARANLEGALSSSELINPNKGMTRAEAISKLKESKELLDLEMMTQEEYNKIKKELTPIIKG